jgi:hypothetical protein
LRLNTGTDSLLVSNLPEGDEQVKMRDAIQASPEKMSLLQTMVPT